MAKTPASAARTSSWAADRPLAIGSSGDSSSTVKKTAMKLQMESPVVRDSTCSHGCGQPRVGSRTSRAGTCAAQRSGGLSASQLCSPCRACCLSPACFCST